MVWQHYPIEHLISVGLGCITIATTTTEALVLIAVLACSRRT
jgi:hypothetical protein